LLSALHPGVEISHVPSFEKLRIFKTASSTLNERDSKMMHQGVMAKLRGGSAWRNAA
jgi:hypothetical protein